MFGTALSAGATRVLLLGSGELGKEVAIECQRLGIEVIACDRYANAPAMQVAHRSHVFNMLDPAALRGVIELVPAANPIGLAQMFQATHQGRFDFSSGKNFNRDFPNLAQQSLSEDQSQMLDL